MRLRIVTDDGSCVGEIETSRIHQWRDLLLYVSGRWDHEEDEPETVAILLALKKPRLPKLPFVVNNNDNGPRNPVT